MKRGYEMRIGEEKGWSREEERGVDIRKGQALHCHPLHFLQVTLEEMRGASEEGTREWRRRYEEVVRRGDM